MTKKLYEMQAELCKTLSNPKRLEILDILKEQQMTEQALGRVCYGAGENEMQSRIFRRSL